MRIMNNNIMIVLIIVVSVIVLYLIYTVFKGNSLAEKLAILIANKQYKEFDELSASKQAIKYIKPFNLDYLKLNRAIDADDEKKVKKLLDDFKNVHMNNRQKSVLYSRAFFYYVVKGQYKDAEQYYNNLVSINGIKIPDRINYIFDTYCKKSYSYIEEIESKLDKANENEKMEYYALLADMYMNKKDPKKAEEYRKIVTDKMKG